MAEKLYSDNQDDVDALAARIEATTSFSAAQAANIALQLLGRKKLKIKSGALAQIFKSLDRDADTKACRDELLRAGVVEKLPGSGLEGKPALYRIVMADEQAEDEVEVEAETVVEVEEPEVIEVEAERIETVVEEPAPREFVSKVGRGSALNRRVKKRDEKPQPAKETPVEEPVAPVEPVEPKPEEPTAPKHEKPAEKPAKPAAEQPKAQSKQKKRRKHRSEAPAKDAQPKKQQDKKAPKKAPKQTPEPEEHARRVPVTAIARVLGRRIVKSEPVSRALARVKHERKEIVKVQDAPKAEAPKRQNQPARRSMHESIDLVMAWVSEHGSAEMPYASRRQRAYEILGDEKAFDGKSGERLLKCLAGRGITPLTLKMSPSRPSHFTGFYSIGSNKPFVVVENLDTYDEVCRLLKGKKSVKLFGIKVGGVIFGGGCKASVSHALDEYLSDIGYGFDYVYYAGDIDREGTRIIEQTRAANVIEVRMHVGMYRAMLAEHKRRVKDGFAPEPAATMQGIPQDLATTIKDLPMVTRIQFRNILRDNQRIPQEILMTSDYRDGDADGFDRIINK